jgi:hypothetical protein
MITAGDDTRWYPPLRKRRKKKKNEQGNVVGVRVL